MADRPKRFMSLGLVFAAMAWMASLATVPIRDPDDWWHLRLGNDLIAQGSLSTPSHWSTFATESWVPTEPLPEVISAYVDRWLGLPGLAFLFGVALLLVVVTLQLTNRREAAQLPASLATLVAVSAATLSLTPRPQLVSFVLIPVVLAAWLQTERDLKPRWWLVPLVWLWSLCHGFWIFGPAIGAVFVVGIALSRRADRRTLVGLGAVALASGAVVALNPVGLGVLEAPLAVHGIAPYVLEWQRTDLLTAAPIVTFAMIVTTAATWVRTRRGITWSRLGLLLAAAFLLWYATRLVVVADLLAAPLFAAALGTWVYRPAEASEQSRRPARGEMWAIGIGALVTAVAVAVAVPVTSDRPGHVPTGLDDTLDRLPGGTPIFNTYSLGGWISWRHPGLQQYIDGLATPYSVEHVRDYVRADATDPGWYRVVRDSGAPVALLESGSELATALSGKGWTTEGSSAGYVLLRRPG